MRFENKKYKAKVREILTSNYYTSGFGIEKSVEEIVALIKAEHVAKEHFRTQRDNCLIEISDLKYYRGL